MIDKYFIKSFLSTSLFIGILISLLIGFSFFSAWFVLSFWGMILLFFIWFYRIDTKFIGLIATIFAMLIMVKESTILFLKKIGLEKK